MAPKAGKKRKTPAAPVVGGGVAASPSAASSQSAAAATPAPQSRTRIVWQRHTDGLPLVFGADADVKHNEHMDDDEDQE